MGIVKGVDEDLNTAALGNELATLVVHGERTGSDSPPNKISISERWCAIAARTYGMHGRCVHRLCALLEEMVLRKPETALKVLCVIAHYS